MRTNETQPGSKEYAFDLADCLASHRDDSIELTYTDITECDRALRAYARRGLRRAFGVRVPSLDDFRETLLRAWWTLRDVTLEVRWKIERSRRECDARVLASDIDALRRSRPNIKLLFRSKDDELAVESLRFFASRRARRARAIAWACVFATVVALGARDGNQNGRADLFDLAAAARAISGFGPGAPEAARRTAAPLELRKG